MSEIGADAIRKLSEQIAAFGRQEQPSSVWGTVKSNGKDVTVLIDGGEVPTPIDECLVSVNVGDRVRVEVDGGKAVVTGNSTTPPTGDEEAVKAGKAAVEALDGQKRIEQHFWADSDGAHVSETERGTDGGNLLLRSEGTYIRDGEKNLMSVSYKPSGWPYDESKPYSEIMSPEANMLIGAAPGSTMSLVKKNESGLSSTVHLYDYAVSMHAYASDHGETSGCAVSVVGGETNAVYIEATHQNSLGNIDLVGNVNVYGNKATPTINLNGTVKGIDTAFGYSTVTLINSESVAANGYKGGTATGTVAGGPWYPLAVCGWYSHTRYYVPVRLQISSQGNNSVDIDWLIYNPHSKAISSKFTVRILWVRMAA